MKLMIRKKTIIFVIIFIFAIISIYFYNKVKFDYKMLKHEVISTLSSQGYSNDAYKFDEGINWKSIFADNNPYFVKVIFNHEPSTIYYYKYNENPQYGTPSIEVVRVKETINTYMYIR